MACPLRPASLASFVSALALATSLAAQCGLNWLPGTGANGPYGSVHAILVLPNGDLVAGGWFPIADSTFASNIARWNGTAWLPLGAGVSNRVYALARMPNGDIVAGGTFTMAGGQPASRIARWDGSSWAPLGPGLDGTVNALLVLPNGDLVAGGAFHGSGAATTNLVAQWNGVSWSPLGSGLFGTEVTSLARMPNGDIIAGGNILQGGSPYGLQRWDGVSWQPVPGLNNAYVSDVVVRPNGDLVATGDMFIGSVLTSAVRWDGIAMQSLNPPPVSNPIALIAMSNGDVWMGVTGSAWVRPLHRWNGTSWTSVPNGPPDVRALAEDGSGCLLVGAPGAEPVPPVLIQHTVTRLNGANWQTIGAPAQPLPDVRAMVRMRNGDVVVGGSFASFGGVAANNLARWNGSVWSPLGLGVGGPVSALAAAPNGDVVVSGSFVDVGGSPAIRVARWNGQVWSSLAGGLGFAALHLAAGANGEILAVGGPTNVARFDGLTWGQLAVPGILVMDVASLPNGSFAIGGILIGTGASVCVVSGGTVTPLPGGPTDVLHLLADSRGGLVAYGNNTGARWDGTTWTPLPAAQLNGLGELPNGDLIASGAFASLGGGAASSIYRLRSSGWESFGEVRANPSPPVFVTASGGGDLFVAGPVYGAANVTSLGFAHGQPTCPAAASSIGAGCTGGAGPVTLIANNTPWVGGVFTATASGMTTNSLAVQVLGSPALAQPLPSPAGCWLLTAPILMDLLVPSGGTATSAWAVPAVPSLAGLQVRLQVVGIELAAAGIVRLTSTNALDLMIGAL